MRHIIITIICLLLPFSAMAAVPAINTIANASTAVNATYTVQPTLSQGADVTWTKTYGHDDVTVNPTTGAVSWAIPAGFARESFHIGVKAKNADGEAETTWIVKVGGGNFIYVGAGETYTTISAGTAAMTSGDTLVIRDGTYTGTSNTLANISGGRGSLPPEGSAGIYSTVMAEHPGSVIMDGQSARVLIYVNGSYADRSGQAFTSCPGSYMAFKGIIAGNSGQSAGPIQTNHASHIKIIDCGAYDAPDLNTPISINRSEYVLVEGCYVWGKGRMRIVVYFCDYSIMRRNIARHDRSNDAEPIGLYDVYASQHTRLQNNIAIDSDQYSYYTSYTNAVGAFIDQNGSASGYGGRLDNAFYNNIALNIYNRFTNYQNEAESDTSVFQNNIGWSIKAIPNAVTDTEAAAIIYIPYGVSLNQNTFGAFTSPLMPMQQSSGVNIPIVVSGWAGTQSITNSIFYDMKDYDNVPAGLFDGIETVNYNSVYGLGTINVKNNGTISNTITTNPTTSCLKYLPRIEASCSLQTAGLSGARVGANIMNMRGKSGTLWGETGYDTEGTTPMWPFPHEALIKSKMQAYSYDNGNLTGNRGFASSTAKQLNGTSDVTLTSYIWEYLGNPIPADMYSVSAVNGTCGTASGQSFATTPTANLCSTGTATAVTGQWSWGCNGSNGGTSTTACSATLAGQAVSAVFKGSKITGGLK